MAQRATVILLLLTLAMLPASAQWQFMGLFPAGSGSVAGDTIRQNVNDMHGITVTPDDKVWTQRLGVWAKDTVQINDFLLKTTAGADSVLVTRTIPLRMLHVYNPDGTEASFSPVWRVQIAGKWDTLGGERISGTLGLRWDGTLTGGGNSTNTGRGLRYDNNGNVLATYFGHVYRIKYQDGTGVSKIPLADGASSGVAVGADADGNVYYNRVVAGNRPLKLYDNTNTFVSNVLDTLTGFSRATLARSSGNTMDVLYSDYTTHRVLHIQSTNNILGPWTVVDTILKGFDCESMEWNPKTGHLWASAGSFNDMPNRYPGTVTGYTPGTWYGYNMSTKQITDSLTWTFAVAGSTLERPRGIAFSTGGDTAYVVVFGGNALPGIRRYRKVTTSVETIDNTVPSGYTIDQNYPNPFNPSTEIRFTMAKAGVASIVVYDMLGREVGVLINEFVSAGTHKTTFLAEGLPSGTYIYTLYANGATVSKKMTLLK
jgi:hypothetical protein